ncbi:MAG: AF1514 family protein [Sulfuricella sp.]
MQDINVSLSGIAMNYKMASQIAHAIAHEINGKEPIVVAWHDKPQARMSPVIEGGDIHTRWHDYGASHGGKLEVDINGDYDFIFADPGEYESGFPSPYVSVHDAKGQEFLCQINALKDPQKPSEDACVKLDESGKEL